jgi:hypothetical protein
MSIHIHVIDL